MKGDRLNKNVRNISNITDDITKKDISSLPDMRIKVSELNAYLDTPTDSQEECDGNSNSKRTALKSLDSGCSDENTNFNSNTKMDNINRSVITSMQNENQERLSKNIQTDGIVRKNNFTAQRTESEPTYQTDGVLRKSNATAQRTESEPIYDVKISGLRRKKAIRYPKITQRHSTPIRRTSTGTTCPSDPTYMDNPPPPFRALNSRSTECLELAVVPDSSEIPNGEAMEEPVRLRRQSDIYSEVKVGSNCHMKRVDVLRGLDETRIRCHSECIEKDTKYTESTLMRSVSEDIIPNKKHVPTPTGDNQTMPNKGNTRKKFKFRTRFMSFPTLRVSSVEDDTNQEIESFATNDSECMHAESEYLHGHDESRVRRSTIAGPCPLYLHPGGYTGHRRLTKSEPVVPDWDISWDVTAYLLKKQRPRIKVS